MPVSEATQEIQPKPLSVLSADTTVPTTGVLTVGLTAWGYSSISKHRTQYSLKTRHYFKCFANMNSFTLQTPLWALILQMWTQRRRGFVTCRGKWKPVLSVSRAGTHAQNVRAESAQARGAGAHHPQGSGSSWK